MGTIKLLRGIAFLLAGAGLVVMYSCNKSNSSSTSARILFANGCVGAASTSLTVNGANLANATAIAYLGNSGYQQVASGSAAINAMLTGVGTLGSFTDTLFANKSYSVFECGTVLAPKLVLMLDLLPTSPGNYAYARLVNVSSDSTATSMTAAVGNTVVGSGVEEGGSSLFTQIAPGAYNLTAFNPNEPGDVATLSSVQLNAGQIYTLMYSGNSNQTVGFKLTVINNN